MTENAPKRSLIERVVNPADELSKTLNPSNRLKKLLFLWEKGAHAGQLSDFIGDLAEQATAEERLKLAAILVEAGFMTEAVDLAVRTYAETPGLLFQIRYAALTLIMSRLQPQSVAELEPEIAALERFARQGDLFRRLVEENKGSIAVVGNSPVLLQREDGAEIDEHSMVIRFNNFQTEPKMRKHTGARTTIWFRVPNLKIVWRRDRNDFDMTLVDGPGFYRMRNAQDLIVEHDMFGMAYDFVPQAVNRKLRQQFGIGAPSKGVLCLSWLHSILGSLSDIGIYGFQLTDQPVGGSTHYFEQAHPHSKHPHDWEAEYRVLHELAPDRFPAPLMEKLEPSKGSDRLDQIIEQTRSSENTDISQPK